MHSHLEYTVKGTGGNIETKIRKPERKPNPRDWFAYPLENFKGVIKNIYIFEILYGGEAKLSMQKSDCNPALT